MRVAHALVGAGSAARKVTVLGTASGESITLTALTLARLMAQQAKIVVVDLVASSPMMTAVSADPVAPGLAELMQGEASFAQIITRDRLSRAHLVSAVVFRNALRLDVQRVRLRRWGRGGIRHV